MLVQKLKLSSKLKKLLTTTQVEALNKYWNHTGFEPMHLGDIEDGSMSFDEAWSSNLDFMQTLTDECRRITTRTPEEESQRVEMMRHEETLRHE